MRDYLEKISLKSNDGRCNFIIQTLTKFNCPYFIQREKMGNTWIENIIVRIKKGPPKIVIGAHYDTFNESSGANDNGSGVCVLLRFLEDYLNEFPNIASIPIEFVFFDSEETGLLGSKAYLNRVQESDIAAMLNLDTIGIGDTILLAPKKSLEKTALGNAVSSVNNLGKYNIRIVDQLPPSDELSFLKKQIPSILAFTINNNDVENMIRIVSNETEDESL